MRVVEQAGIVLVDEPGELLVGQEQQHVVDGRLVALAGVLAPGQLLHPRPHVAEEALEVGLALGVGADLEVAQVRRQRELDVHVQHVALGQVERVVRPARAAADLGLLAVVDVLGEPGEAQHVLGHPLAPLAAGLRVRQRLAEHARRVGERAGDLGVRAQRLVDLPEALGAGRAQLGDQRAEPLQLGAHLRPHLVEAGVDDVLLRRQVGLHVGGHGRGRAAELLAVEHGGLLERGAHRGIALGAGARRDLGDGVVDGGLHGVGERRAAPFEDEVRDARRQRPGEEHAHHDQDDHAAMMRGGCDSERGCGAQTGKEQARSGRHDGPMAAEPSTERVRVRRGAIRAEYDRAAILEVLDAGLIAHVGVMTDEGPIVLPMAYGRDDEWLYVHGSVANAALRAAVGQDICVTVTIVDGIVIGRSPFHNSMNYRGVVVRGVARRVDDPDEHARALRLVSDHVVATWDTGRPPSDAEVRKTMVDRRAARRDVGEDPCRRSRRRAGGPRRSALGAATCRSVRRWEAPVGSADLPAGVGRPGGDRRLGGS